MLSLLVHAINGLHYVVSVKVHPELDYFDVIAYTFPDADEQPVIFRILFIDTASKEVECKCTSQTLVSPMSHLLLCLLK